MGTAKFQTIELFQAIAEREVERLKNIARRNQCHINKYELETDNSKLYIVPKATSSNSDDRTSSKVLREQSDLFCFSTDVIRKFTLNNGSISVSIGDITKKKLLDTLQKQKLQIQTTFQSNSAARRRRPLTASSAATTTSIATALIITNTTCYNIMLSYCSKDQTLCQRLANRLINDGFSVLMVEI
ncbi:unnamed protein product [Rotaria sp. Silwood2]|nr:unnamed protein product [Rotaria sp. Silwood2]CAF4600647.1 unnamed protein product [Rotaria sp. Silwood2]CAF4652209.1 unnamed protein product [Rotaria sp. Silwood2]